MIQPNMVTAVIVIIIVLAVIAGTILTLRTTARQGMPPKDVLERANRRSREQDARDETGE
jgi:Protein of unknown function (DUF2897)